MKYVYIQSEPSLWTVGFYDPDGKWVAESDWESTDAASKRALIMNGGTPEPINIEEFRKEIEDQMKGYRAEQKNTYDDYWRGAADACANILDLLAHKQGKPL